MKSLIKESMLDLTKLDNIGVEKVENWIKTKQLKIYDKQYLEQIRNWLIRQERINTKAFVKIETEISNKKIKQIFGIRNDYLVPVAEPITVHKTSYFIRFLQFFKGFKKQKYKPLLEWQIDTKKENTV